MKIILSINKNTQVFKEAPKKRFEIIPAIMLKDLETRLFTLETLEIRAKEGSSYIINISFNIKGVNYKINNINKDDVELEHNENKDVLVFNYNYLL